MADAILMSGGVGGVTSDDVTARREQVLQGYTALTADSGDEPVQGTMVNRGAWNAASEVVNATWENKVHVRFEEGYYPKDGNYKPAAIVPYDVLANAIGLDASKMLSDLNVLGKQGQIKSIDTAASNFRINKSTAFGIDNWTNPSNPVFYVDFPHGDGYYKRSDGHPHTCIDAVNLGDATPDKVMRGFTATSKNGVRFAGTMPDYSSGRVAFRNATFDSILASGVANIGLGNSLNVYSKPSTEIRDGIIRFYNGGSVSGGGLHQYRSNAVLEEAVTLAHSVNLTPFRTIRLGLKYPYGGRWGTVGGVGSLAGVLWALPTSITPEYVPSRNAKINPNVIKRVGYKDGVIPATQGQWNTPTEIPVGAEYFVDIDVSDLQGHHRIVLGIAVAEANHRENFTIQVNVYVNNSISGISHIEFIN